MSDERPLDWLSIDEAATKCRRTAKTIENLISLHQLPRRRLWVVRNRLRRRVTFLSPETVRWLQRVTLEGVSPDTVQVPKA